MSEFQNQQQIQNSKKQKLLEIYFREEIALQFDQNTLIYKDEIKIKNDLKEFNHNFIIKTMQDLEKFLNFQEQDQLQEKIKRLKCFDDYNVETNFKLIVKVFFDYISPTLWMQSQSFVEKYTVLWRKSMKIICGVYRNFNVQKMEDLFGHLPFYGGPEDYLNRQWNNVKQNNVDRIQSTIYEQSVKYISIWIQRFGRNGKIIKKGSQYTSGQNSIKIDKQNGVIQQLVEVYKCIMQSSLNDNFTNEHLVQHILENKNGQKWIKYLKRITELVESDVLFKKKKAKLFNDEMHQMFNKIREKLQKRMASFIKGKRKMETYKNDIISNFVHTFSHKHFLSLVNKLNIYSSLLPLLIDC